MRDIMGMMKKAKEMQAKMQEMQAEMDHISAEGQAGGGMVRVVLSGDGKMKSVALDDELLKAEEKEILEDLLLAAHNEAKRKLESIIAEKTREMTAGLPIPPGLKLPF